jgi:hypothetical protein
MALTNKQVRIASKIDARMRRLIRGGEDDAAILAAMADHMRAFHQLLSTAQPGDLEEITDSFPGCYRYAKILETLAAGIRSGAIPVPGRKEPHRRAKPMTNHRQRAAAMDLRMKQLAEEGVPRSAIIDRMTGYVVDLGEIWNKTTDEQLSALCDAYPNFHAYAVLMEEAAEAERKKPSRPYLPALPEALKEQLSSLLSIAARLERDYQSVLDAAGTSAPTSQLLPLSGLHAQWQADLTCFRAALQSAGVPLKARDMVLPALERMARHIGELKARIQAASVIPS